MVLTDMDTIDVLILGWQVALFFITLAILLFLGKTKLSLITTYLFTLFWGFYFYWGSYIASNASLLPLAIYVACGMLHVGLTVFALHQNGEGASMPRQTI